MSLLRRQLSISTSNNIETRDANEIKSKTGNLYESIAIIAKRANQINISLKEELHNKLEEFASHTDSLEEIHENKEQIEISRDLNLPRVCEAMSRSLAMSEKSSTGCETSSRICGLRCTLSSRFGFGPMKPTSDITIASRIGSIGGLVTCANSCLK